MVSYTSVKMRKLMPYTKLRYISQTQCCMKQVAGRGEEAYILFYWIQKQTKLISDHKVRTVVNFGWMGYLTGTGQREASKEWIPWSRYGYKGVFTL